MEVEIRGALVGFLRRDVRQISDRERRLVEWLVEDQQREARLDGKSLTRLTINTDYPDRDRMSWTASFRAERTERVDPQGCDGGREQG